MPIDSSIALSFRPAQIAVPDAGETLRLRDLALATRQRQLQIQQQQRMIDQQEALKKAMVVDDQGRVDLPKSLAAINRIDPTVGLELQTQLQTQQKAQQEALKRDFSQRAWALYQTPIEKRGGIYPRMRAEALATGLYKSADLPEEVPDEDSLRWLALNSMSPEEQQKVLKLVADERRQTEKTAREAQESSAKLEGQKLSNLQAEMGVAERTLPQTADDWASWRAGLSPALQRRIPQAFSPAAVAQVQRMALPRKERAELEKPKMPTSNAQLAWMASDPQAPDAQRAAATAALRRVEAIRRNAQQGLGVPNIPNATPLPADWTPGQLNEPALPKYPASAQRLARQLIEYKVPMPTGAAAGREPWASAIQAAGELDPTWIASEYQSRLALRRSLTSGKDANTITSINTAVAHLKSLKDAADGLSNTDWPWINSAKNYLSSRTGSEGVRRFGVAATAVQNELATVFKQTGATDQEIKAWRDNLDSSDSPAQFSGAINQAIELLAGRLNAIYNKFELGFQKPADFRILSEKSASILKSIGVDPAKIDPSHQVGGTAERRTEAPPKAAATAGARNSGGVRRLRYNPRTDVYEVVR